MEEPLRGVWIVRATTLERRDAHLLMIIYKSATEGTGHWLLQAPDMEGSYDHTFKRNYRKPEQYQNQPRTIALQGKAYFL